MGNYECLDKIYNFAKENGYKVDNLNLGERQNRKGEYKYITLSLIIPGKDYKPYTPNYETTNKEKNDSANEAQKEEVVNNEI